MQMRFDRDALRKILSHFNPAARYQTIKTYFADHAHRSLANRIMALQFAWAIIEIGRAHV